jgi:hypothetical protein
MVRIIALRLVVALPFAISLAIAGPAAAQKAKKLSYEQAWAKCKAEVDRTIPGDQQINRATAGGSCMRSHGYRLKKKM